jgi:hypothetical protein
LPVADFLSDGEGAPMPLDPKKISALRENVAKQSSRVEALKIIGSLDPKKSIPVILYILDELLKNHRHVPATVEFVKNAIRILTEADQKQNVSIFSLHSVLKGLTKEKIDGDLTGLIKQVDVSDFTLSAESLWKEVGLWLEGIYKHTYDDALKYCGGEIKENHKGLVGPIDMEDRIFHGITGLTKYTVALYYHRAAVAIDEKIAKTFVPKPAAEVEVKETKEVKAAKDTKEVKEVKEKKPLDDISEEKSSSSDVIQVAASPSLFKIKKKNGHIKISYLLPEAQESKTDEIKTAIEHVVSGSPLLFKDDVEEKKHSCLVGLSQLLDIYKNDCVDVRFAILVSAVEKYTISVQDEQLIQKYIPIIKARISSYSSASLSTYWIPTLLRSRPHTMIVDDALKKIGTHETPAHNLKVLFDLWVELENCGSKDLYPKVTELIDGMYSILVKGSDAALMPRDLAM